MDREERAAWHGQMLRLAWARMPTVLTSSSFQGQVEEAFKGTAASTALEAESGQGWSAGPGKAAQKGRISG